MTVHTEPASLIAGDTATWQISHPDYPASAGWVMVYTLVNGAESITFSSTANGDAHLIHVAATVTRGWEPGAYHWRCRATLAGDVFTIRSGTTRVQVAFEDVDASTDTTLLQSHARKMLAAIEAYLENPANLSAAKYEIAGRSLERYKRADLIVERSRYLAEVAREDNAARIRAGLGSNNNIMVRFTHR